MTKKTAQVFIYENGSEHEFGFAISETKNALARDVVVGIKAYTRDLDEEGNRIEETNITISEVTLPVGSYANGLWSLGDIQNITHDATFKFTIDNDLVSNFYIEVTATTSSSEVSVINNLKETEYIGLHKQQVPAPVLFSDTEALTGTYYGADPVYVRTFNVTSADFASTIYTTNLLKASVKLLLNWDYNVKSGSGTIIYDKFGGVAPQVVFGGFATYVTISNLVNSATVSYLFTLYYTKN